MRLHFRFWLINLLLPCSFLAGIPCISQDVSSASVTTPCSNTPRTLRDRFSDEVNVKDFGANGSLANDILAIQAAITATEAAGGGTILIPFGVSQLVLLENLTFSNIPKVAIRDERWANDGHFVSHHPFGDAELRLEGTAVQSPGGGGPSLVLQNLAPKNDWNRSSTIVSRYGPRTSQVVNGQIQFGSTVTNPVNTWYPDLDFQLQDIAGLSPLRSRFRIGQEGSVIVNPNNVDGNEYMVPHEAHGFGHVFMVNAFYDGSGKGNLFDVRLDSTTIRGELHLQSTNSPLRLYSNNGVLNWSVLTDFPNSGQFTIYNHQKNAPTISISPEGALSLPPVAAAEVRPNSLFIDSTDGKLKFKDSNGILRSLY